MFSAKIANQIQRLPVSSVLGRFGYARLNVAVEGIAGADR